MYVIEDSPTVALDAVDSGENLPLYYTYLGGKLGVLVNFILGISPHGVSELNKEGKFAHPVLCGHKTQFIVCCWKNQETLWQLFVQGYLLLRSKDGDADKNNKMVN